MTARHVLEREEGGARCKGRARGACEARTALEQPDGGMMMQELRVWVETPRERVGC